MCFRRKNYPDELQLTVHITPYYFKPLCATIMTSFPSDAWIDMQVRNHLSSNDTLSFANAHHDRYPPLCPPFSPPLLQPASPARLAPASNSRQRPVPPKRRQRNGNRRRRRQRARREAPPPGPHRRLQHPRLHGRHLRGLRHLRPGQEGVPRQLVMSAEPRNRKLARHRGSG